MDYLIEILLVRRGREIASSLARWAMSIQAELDLDFPMGSYPGDFGLLYSQIASRRLGEVFLILRADLVAEPCYASELCGLILSLCRISYLYTRITKT